MSREPPSGSVTGTPSRNGKARGGRLRVILAVIVVCIVLLVVDAYYEFARPQAWPSEIVVKGSVAVSPGTTPLEVAFYGEGRQYTSQVSNETYSVELPNRQTYNVTEYVVTSATGREGTCDLGQLSLNTPMGTYLYNLKGC